MKNSITSLSLANILTFSLLTLSSAIQPAFAETGIQQKDCQESRRGTRCKVSSPQDIISAGVSGSAGLELKVCAKSARGTRCQNRVDNFIMAENMKTPAMNDSLECKATVRGTRGCEI